jgi:hypothetical protein
MDNFFGDLSPWNNTLATMENGTHDQKQMIPITVKNWKLVHVTSRKKTMKNGYHDILKTYYILITYINKFDTMKQTKTFHPMAWHWLNNMACMERRKDSIERVIIQKP